MRLLQGSQAQAHVCSFLWAGTYLNVAVIYKLWADGQTVGLLCTSWCNHMQLCALLPAECVHSRQCFEGIVMVVHNDVPECVGQVWFALLVVFVGVNCLLNLLHSAAYGTYCTCCPGGRTPPPSPQFAVVQHPPLAVLPELFGTFWDWRLVVQGPAVLLPVPCLCACRRRFFAEKCADPLTAPPLRQCNPVHLPI